MQEDEGFCSAQSMQFIELNELPFKGQHSYKRKHPGPSSNSEVPLHNYLPERDQFRSNYTQSIIFKEKQYIVFNNYNGIVGNIQEQLIFSTLLPSSNLQIALKRKFLQYQLYLRPDTNTNNYFQWFYFKVRCMKGKKNVTFIIKNFIKSRMLYSQGLKPYYKSSNNIQQQFSQLSTPVKFYEQLDQGDYYNLKFTYYFQSDHEEVQFCSQPPYTYQKLLKRLKEFGSPTNSLCKSLLGKKVPYLVLNQNRQTTSVVIVIARQHPGQSIGSWLMDGFLSNIHEKIYEQIQWYIIPMMNVDGVILGNTRTGLLGFDYNRCWNVQQLLKKQRILPELVAVVNLMKKIKRKHPKKMKIFLDFHGHSSQQNVFSYGPPCEYSSQQHILSKIWPQLMSKRNINFNIGQCSYTIKAEKRNTARSLMYNYFNIAYSYTIQSSFGLMRGLNIGIRQYLKIGADIAQNTHQFISRYLVKQKSQQILNCIAFYKEKYKDHIEVQEYDSQNQGAMTIDTIRKNKPKTSLFMLGYKESPVYGSKGQKQSRIKIKTQSTNSSFIKHYHEQTHMPILQSEQGKFQNRYEKSIQRKRNQTQTSVQIDKKIHLPKIKESLALKSGYHRQMQVYQPSSSIVQENPMINLRQIQKKLFKLRNGRIGKKILILNSQGV